MLLQIHMLGTLENHFRVISLIMSVKYNRSSKQGLKGYSTKLTIGHFPKQSLIYQDAKYVCRKGKSIIFHLKNKKVFHTGDILENNTGWVQLFTGFWCKQIVRNSISHETSFDIYLKFVVMLSIAVKDTMTVESLTIFFNNTSTLPHHNEAWFNQPALAMFIHRCQFWYPAMDQPWIIPYNSQIH